MEKLSKAKKYLQNIKQIHLQTQNIDKETAEVQGISRSDSTISSTSTKTRISPSNNFDEEMQNVRGNLM